MRWATIASLRSWAPLVHASSAMPLTTLHVFIAANHDEIVRRAQKKASKRSSLRPTDAELDKGIPLFLDHLVEALRRSTSRPDVMPEGHATEHGGHLERMGFSIAQVVHGYGDVCQVVTELAIELDASIAVDDFRVFNGCLDESIAEAVTEYERRRSQLLSREGTERIAILAHELRNSLHTAMLAFGALKRGAVGTESSTANLLNRSLLRLNEIVEWSVAEVRRETAPRFSRIAIASLLEDTEIASSIEAANRGVTLSVHSVPGLEVDGDPLLLAGALANLVQNAFKFTPAGGHILITAREERGRILIEIEDACGGLPPGTAEDLFGLFEQRGTDRTGLGVGLSFARSTVRASHGEIHVRNIPSKGCVFTIDLPRAL